jgi:CHAD domain-containing protein
VNALPAQRTHDPALKSKLVKLARKRLERFVTLYPKALVSDDPEIIHDLRVASRRLQQALQLLPSHSKSANRKLFKVLRRVRRAFGACRNRDVCIGLIQAKLEAATAVSMRHSWDAVRFWLEEKRATEIDRARAELKRHDLIEFIARVQARIGNIDQEPEGAEPLWQGLKEPLAEWRKALVSAKAQPQNDQIHAFRISGKRLRYQAESIAELGDTSVKKLVQGLKTLQDDLGDWRDRSVLRRYVAEFIGRLDFLAEEPGMCRALLLEMEREKQRDQAMIDEVIAKAEKLAEDSTDLGFGEPSAEAAAHEP